MKVLLGECPRLEGTFMIRNDMFQRFVVTSRSGMFVMELLIRARRAGARIVNIDQKYYRRPDMSQSKVVSIQSIPLHFREILDLRRRLS